MHQLKFLGFSVLIVTVLMSGACGSDPSGSDPQQSTLSVLSSQGPGPSLPDAYMVFVNSYLIHTDGSYFDLISIENLKPECDVYLDQEQQERTHAAAYHEVFVKSVNQALAIQCHGEATQIVQDHRTPSSADPEMTAEVSLILENNQWTIKIESNEEPLVIFDSPDHRPELLSKDLKNPGTYFVQYPLYNPNHVASEEDRSIIENLIYAHLNIFYTSHKNESFRVHPAKINWISSQNLMQL